MISLDYMGPKSKADKSDPIDSLPIIAGVDRKHKYPFAHMVPKKGHDAHAIKMVSREIKLSGHSRLTIKSDQESSIKKVIEASMAERPEKIDLILTEESPVGEHSSNGEVEGAIRRLQGQVRTIKAAAESKYKNTCARL